jgi:hypothetical protein
MNLDDALRRYRMNQFTDQDVMRCTDLSDRKWRELIKDKLVRTFMHTPGRGRVRLCDATTLKRAAVIAALNRAGFSLAVSARIAYYAPFHTALYELCDPCAILLQSSTDVQLGSGLPPRAQKRLVDWFDEGSPARPDSGTDWIVKIYEARFVGIQYKPKDLPIIFGDLRDAGTRFVAWLPLHRKSQFMGCGIEKLAREFGRERLAEAVAAWEDPTRWSRELNLLGYGYEKRASEGDPLRAAAEAAISSPLFTATINISLAIRKALRRYLGIEPVELSSKVGEPR